MEDASPFSSSLIPCTSPGCPLMGITQEPTTVTVKSIGNGIEIEGVDTLKIDKLTPDSLVLSSNYGYTLEYVRQK